MIFTSYFAKVPELISRGFSPSDLIGISHYEAKFVDVDYEKKLAPKLTLLWNLKSGLIDWHEYSVEFYNQLYDLPWVFWRDFEKNFDGKVLLCYEKNYKQCHRYLVGKFYEWWSGKSGVFKEF